MALVRGHSSKLAILGRWGDDFEVETWLAGNRCTSGIVKPKIIVQTERPNTSAKGIWTISLRKDNQVWNKLFSTSALSNSNTLERWWKCLIAFGVVVWCRGLQELRNSVQLGIAANELACLGFILQDNKIWKVGKWTPLVLARSKTDRLPVGNAWNGKRITNDGIWVARIGGKSCSDSVNPVFVHHTAFWLLSTRSAQKRFQKRKARQRYLDCIFSLGIWPSGKKLLGHQKCCSLEIPSRDDKVGGKTSGFHPLPLPALCKC